MVSGILIYNIPLLYITIKETNEENKIK